MLALPTPIRAGASQEVEPALSQVTDSRYIDSVMEAYRAAETAFRDDPKSATAAWQFGRACFDVGEIAKSKEERARVAEEGMAACREALELQPNSVEAQYYLGMNVGQLARSKGIGALRLVGQLRRAFERARELDETIDYGGPDRNLGLLFRDAPSWIIGDKTKARSHLRRAVSLAPTHPENRLELIEAYLKWDETESAARELTTLDELWAKSRQEHVGSKWDPVWPVWEQRREGFRKKLQKLRGKE